MEGLGKGVQDDYSCKEIVYLEELNSLDSF